MTPPIEWNDSEPGFPDFLPPQTDPVALMPEQVAERIKGILEAVGVDVYITGARISARFPDGAGCCYLPFEVNAQGTTRR
jgi:hypothetical protein